MTGQAATTSKQPDVHMLEPMSDGLGHILTYLSNRIPQDPQRNFGRVRSDTKYSTVVPNLHLANTLPS